MTAITDLSQFQVLKQNKYYKINVQTGTIINRKNRVIGAKLSNGYRSVSVSAGQKKGTGKNSQLEHRVIYEQAFGKIPQGLEIDHINYIRHDNRLCNLQLMTVQANRLKAAGNRNYDNVLKKMRKKRPIMIINNEDYTIAFYDSIGKAAAATNVNPGMVSAIANEKPYYHTANDRKDNTSYSFQFAD